MKRYATIIVGAIIAAGSSLAASVAFAQSKISLSIPGNYTISSSTPPGYLIANFYEFALLIGGLIAFGAVVYGGVRYMTSGGNPSAQSEAKEWIWSALLGLLLLIGAYLILYTINPNLVNLGLPTLQPVSISSQQTAGGTGGGGGLGTPNGGVSDPGATQQLNNAGVSVKSGASVNGMQQGTINDIQSLAEACAQSDGGASCNVLITSGTDGDHAGGTCSHANGYKADLRPNSNLDKFITSLPVIGRRSDGAILYAYNGGTIADERNLSGVAPHWDLSAACP